MKILPAGTETSLPVGALFKLEDRVGTLVGCIEGALWISQVAEPHDVVLVAGESIALTAPRAAIVGAINGGAVVRIAQLTDFSLAA